MVAKSVAFARIKRALLAQVCDIPKGHIVEVGALAQAMNISSRHVAFILSQLSTDEAAIVPWYRVIPSGGTFPTAAKRTDRHNRQIIALLGKGIDDTLTNLSRYSWPLPDTHIATFWADED